MSAEELGIRLLAEVHEEGLDEFLKHLRTAIGVESAGFFGIPLIDRLIDGLHQHAHQRKNEPVIEITSAHPGAGKTHLLYYITALAVLPTTFNGVPVKGRNGAVVVLDTDGQFHIPRLVQVISCYLRTCCEEHKKAGPKTATDAGRSYLLLEEKTERFLQDCLQHVHIFRPQSFPSLLATLDSLPSYLLNRNAHHSGNRALHSIILDSASSFFWETRAAEDDAHLGHTTEGGSTGSVRIPYAELIRRLRTLQRTFSCCVVASTWSLSKTPAVSSTGLPSVRPHLPLPWPSFPDLRLVIARDAVPQFAPGMSIARALRDKYARQRVVDEGRFTVIVDQRSSEQWDDRALDNMRQHSVGKSFRFMIRRDGVQLDTASSRECA